MLNEHRKQENSLSTLPTCSVVLAHVHCVIASRSILAILSTETRQTRALESTINYQQ